MFVHNMTFRKADKISQAMQIAISAMAEQGSPDEHMLIMGEVLVEATKARVRARKLEQQENGDRTVIATKFAADGSKPVEPAQAPKPAEEVKS